MSVFKYIGASKYKNVDKSQRDMRRGGHESKGCFLKEFEKETNQLYLQRIPTHCVTFPPCFHRFLSKHSKCILARPVNTLSLLLYSR